MKTDTYYPHSKYVLHKEYLDLKVNHVNHSFSNDVSIFHLFLFNIFIYRILMSKWKLATIYLRIYRIV